MPQNELTCRELVEIVTDYLEGAMPPSERRRLEDHLTGCGGCRAYIDQMRQTVALTGELREEHVEPEAAEALLAVFRDWKRT